MLLRVRYITYLFFAMRSYRRKSSQRLLFNQYRLSQTR